MDQLLGDQLARRASHGRHTIEEFLLTYYSYRPAQLRRWQPGPDVALADADPAEFGPHFTRAADGTVALDVAALLARRRGTVGWVRRLLRATASRPAHLGCFGLHEWAMVYRQPEWETRHHTLPLRLGPAATAELVEELPVRCSHFDAFRFFTPPARSLNRLQPARETRLDDEQPGCLHTNMDLYRWAYTLAPLAASDLVTDCFALAREIRTLDIRASPYDLAAIGLSAVAIETADGRSEYVRQQREFAQRAAVLRRRLLACADRGLRPTT